MSNHAVNVPYRCLVTFRFWHAKEYENTRAASRWVPTGVTLHLSIVTHSFLFLSFILFPVRFLVTFKSWPRESRVRSTLSSRYTCSLTVPRQIHGSRCLNPDVIIRITKDVFAGAFGIFSPPCCRNT